MAAVTDVAWHDEARSLREQGLSERAIAQAVSKSPSQVHEVVKDVDPGGDPRDLDGAIDVAKIPGQQTIDGGEVPEPQPSLPGLELVGTAKLSDFALGGKKPQSASIKFVGGKVELTGGTAYKKGALVYGALLATVVETAQRDKRDKATRQVVTCEQNHKAEIDELLTASSERDLFRALFRRLVDSDMQEAAELADELRVMATGRSE